MAEKALEGKKECLRKEKECFAKRKEEEEYA